MSTSGCSLFVAVGAASVQVALVTLEAYACHSASEYVPALPAMFVQTSNLVRGQPFDAKVLPRANGSHQFITLQKKKWEKENDSYLLSVGPGIKSEEEQTRVNSSPAIVTSLSPQPQN